MASERTPIVSISICISYSIKHKKGWWNSYVNKRANLTFVLSRFYTDSININSASSVASTSNIQAMICIA
jgi:hypothetical protein